MAIVQRVEMREAFDEQKEEWVTGPHDYIVVVVDTASHARLWTLPADALTDLAWSGDGERIAVTHGEGGVVLDAATGETILARRDLGVSVDG